HCLTNEYVYAIFPVHIFQANIPPKKMIDFSFTNDISLHHHQIRSPKLLQDQLSAFVLFPQLLYYVSHFLEGIILEQLILLYILLQHPPWSPLLLVSRMESIWFRPFL